MTTYYLSDNATGAHPNAVPGSNSNDGLSPSTPKRDMTNIVTENLVAGDQILFAIGGAWQSTSPIVWQGIRADAVNGDNPVVYGTYDPGTGTTGKPILRTTGSGSWVMVFGEYSDTPGRVHKGGFKVQGLCIDGNNAANITGIRFWACQDWLTVEDCEVKNCHVGIDIYLANLTGDLCKYVVIRGNDIHDHAFTGFLGGANDILIEKNTIHNNGSNDGFHHGIYYGAGAGADYYRAVMRHNDLYDNNSIGGVLEGGHLTFRGRMNYTTVEDNLVRTSATSMAGPSYAISHFAAYGTNEYHYKTIIRGNRTYNIPVGIYFSSAPGIVIENNVHVDLTSGYTEAAGGIVGVDGGSGLNGDSGDGQAKIRNNSLYFANGRSGMQGVRIQGAAGAGLAIDNNVIVYGSIESSTPYAFSLTESNGVTYTSIRNNFIGGAYNGWHSGYASLSSFQAHFDGLSGTDCSGNLENSTHGLTTPTLENNLNMVPTSGASPVVNAALTGITKLAISGYAREASRDIGAFEYGRNP